MKDSYYGFEMNAFMEYITIKKVLYEGKGRRSGKKEKVFLNTFNETIDDIASEAGVKSYGTLRWGKQDEVKGE